MPPASEQVQRNREIAAAHAAGESVKALAARYGLSSSRVKQIVKSGTPSALDPEKDPMRIAMERRSDYRDVVEELRGLASRLPDTQASAKVGAFRALLDALDRLTALERATGFLPDDLGRLRSERALAEAVFAVFVEHDVPMEAREALVRRLGHERAA